MSSGKRKFDSDEEADSHSFSDDSGSSANGISSNGSADADDNNAIEGSAIEGSNTTALTNVDNKLMQLVKPNTFSFLTTQTLHLSTLFHCLASVASQLRIVISADGIVATCSNQTTMGRWVLRKAEMIDSLFSPPLRIVEIVVDLDLLSTVMGACARCDSICFSLDNDANPEKLILNTMEDGVRGNFPMDLNIVEDHLEIPPLQYGNRVVLTANSFDKLRIKTKTKFVTFALTENDFTMSMKITRGKASHSWPIDVNAGAGAKTDEQSSASPAMMDIRRIASPQSFLLAEVLSVARMGRATKYVTISMPERDTADANAPLTKPLLISYQLVIGTVSFFLAPLFEEED